ncbi:MAG: transglutaminase-like domain-containing protein [Candidatus Acidiferrales bacterium]
MFADFRSFKGVMGTPLAHGDQGVEQTINVIRQLVDDAVKDPAVNVTAIQMVRGTGDQFSRDAKAQAIYAAVANRFQYVEDPVGPFGPKETLRPARVLLQIWAGDCDDASVLIASLLGTIGIPSRLVTIAADPSAPDEFSHIYPEAEVFPGNWVAMDIARPGSAYGSAPQRYFRKRVWSLTDRAYQDLNGGCRCSSLNGYAVLGDDSTVAQDIAALAPVAQGVAQDISVAEGNPLTSYYTGLTPGAVAPAAMYPSSGAVVASLSGGATPWILGIVALGLVAWGLGGKNR